MDLMMKISIAQFMADILRDYVSETSHCYRENEMKAQQEVTSLSPAHRAGEEGGKTVGQTFTG